MTSSSNQFSKQTCADMMMRRLSKQAKQEIIIIVDVLVVVRVVSMLSGTREQQSIQLVLVTQQIKSIHTRASGTGRQERKLALASD